MNIPKATYIQHGTWKINILHNTYGGFVDRPTNSQFLDLAWFYEPNKTKENQLELVTLCLNLGFGNVRVNGYNNIKNAIHDHSIFLTKDLLTINASIYPSNLFEIHCMRNLDKVIPMEQLFVKYDPENEPWQNNLSKTEFIRRDDMIKMNIGNNEQNYFYVFKHNQLKFLYRTIDFVLTEGLTIVGMRK